VTTAVGRHYRPGKDKGTLQIVYVPAKISRRTMVQQGYEQGCINRESRIIVVIWILYFGA
jgi:hypothetical protein